MEHIHRAFLAHLKGLPYELLLDLIERKLAAQGITLNSRRRARLRRELEQHDGTNRQLCFGRKSNDPDVVLTITDADLAEVETRLRRALQPDTVSSIVDDLASRLGRELDQRWKAEHRRQQRLKMQFSKTHCSRWGVPLSDLEQLLVVSTELGESVNHRLRKQLPGPNPFTVEIQTRLHARACQIAREVLTLLASGFAEGAIARWRALHELTIVSLFIGLDEALAERYRLHEVVESRRVALEYKKHTDRLGLDPLTDAELKDLEANVAALKMRFGPDYLQPYGWAAEKLQMLGKRVTFAQIEAAADLGHFRPYYRLASHSVHADPKGAFFRLGLLEQSQVLLAGPSTFGLAEAGQDTAISLGQITSGLGTLDPTLDHLVAMKIVLALVDRTQRSFVRIHQDLEGTADPGTDNSG